MRRIFMNPSFSILLALICSVLGSFGQLCFKLGLASVSTNILSWTLNLKVMSGITCYGFSALLFVVALKGGNLSVLYPIIATSYVWVALLSSRFLSEKISPAQVLGLGLILIGVFLSVKR